MQHKILSWAAKVILFLFLITNVFLGYLGISSILLTLSVYVMLWMVLRWLVKFNFNSNTDRQKNVMLLVSTLVICLFVGELSLRYVFKINVNYAEVNGDFFYQSEFKQYKTFNLVSRLNKGETIPIILHKPYANSVINRPDFKFVHKYNSLGLRGNEEDAKNNSDHFRIISLGDSFTEGVGVPEDSTWTKLLESKLNERSPGFRTVDCVNAGINGSDPFFEYQTLKSIVTHFNPDMVILSINRSDLHDVVIRGGMDRFKENGKIKYNDTRWWASIYQVSYIARALFRSIGHYKWNLLTLRENKIAELESVEKIRQLILNEYLPLADKYGFQLIVVIHPVKFELEMDEFALNELPKKLKDVNGLTTYNLFEEFTRYCSDHDISYDEIYWPTDLHHNAKGYNIWAEILFEKIKNKVH